MKLKEIYQLWRDSRLPELRGSTMAARDMYWRSLSAWIGDVDASDFDQTRARWLLARMAESGMSDSTMRARMKFTKQLIKYAALYLGEKVPPTDWALRYPELPPPALQSFGSADLRTMMREIAKKAKEEPGAVIPTALALMAGMRLGEVCGLRWEDVDMRRGVISVMRNAQYIYDASAGCCRMSVGAPKTRSAYREIPMPKLLKKVLRGYGGKAPESGRYVVGNGIAPMIPKVVRSAYQRWLTRVSVSRKVTFHGLRHTYATALVAGGGDVKAISVVMGHSTVTTTMDLYVHPTEDDCRRVVGKAFGRFDKLTSQKKVKSKK